MSLGLSVCKASALAAGLASGVAGPKVWHSWGGHLLHGAPHSPYHSGCLCCHTQKGALEIVGDDMMTSSQLLLGSPFQANWRQGQDSPMSNGSTHPTG